LVVVVGIAGGSGSGKTTLAEALARALGEQAAVLIPHDAYYRDLSHLTLAERAQVNFDEPAALDNDRLVADLAALRAGQPISRPSYDFGSHSRRRDGVRVDPHPVVIVEGILVLAVEALRRVFALSVFVETSANTCLERRIVRDLAERGRSRDSVVAQYLHTTRPMHERYVAPSARWAQWTVSGEDDVAVAVALLAPRVLTLVAS
jgi:uridine kinase